MAKTPDKKASKTETVVATNPDQCIGELIQLVAEACGGNIMLDPARYPSLANVAERVLGVTPKIPVAAPPVPPPPPKEN